MCRHILLAPMEFPNFCAKGEHIELKCESDVSLVSTEYLWCGKITHHHHIGPFRISGL